MRTDISIDEAIAFIGETIKRDNIKCGAINKDIAVASWEELNVLKAIGRVTAENVYAEFNQPPFDRSPLDGYALISRDSAGASKGMPIKLTVVAEVDAGDCFSGKIKNGEAVRIMTGAPIPEAADCVIRQEETDYGENEVLIYRELKPFENFCYAGEDYKKGDCLIPADTKITAIEAGILASAGYETVKVKALPKVALFSTGSELYEPGEKLEPGKIYDSNRTLVTSRLMELGLKEGIEIIASEHMKDDAEELYKRLVDVAKQVDLIVTTGGVSVGKKDIMHDVFNLPDTEKLFWRIVVKPGMPVIFGKVCGTPVIALSGNPYGAAVHMELLVRNALADVSGCENYRPESIMAVMDEDFSKGSNTVRYVRAVYKADENGVNRVRLPKGLHSSGVLGSMQGCNCLIEVPAGPDGISEGELVKVIIL